MIGATLTVAHAQVSPLDQQAHRPLQKVITPDNTTPSGYTLAQIRHACGFDQIANHGDGQVIGIVDAYDVPSVESDLTVFSTTFGLPACTKASGCLTVIYATGVQPPQNKGWSDETSLDVQWAHAIAPNAKILFVEASAGTMKALLSAVPVAVKNGGESKYYAEPSYQSAVQNSGFRGIPDVAYDANPNTGVPVYDSEDGNWFQVGGTSASSPQWAALTAIANSVRVAHSKATIGSSFLNVIYASELDFFDITQGNNGFCGALCKAKVGYDFVTGLGSPMAPSVVAALTSAP